MTSFLINQILFTKFYSQHFHNPEKLIFNVFALKSVPLRAK